MHARTHAHTRFQGHRYINTYYKCVAQKMVPQLPKLPYYQTYVPSMYNHLYIAKELQATAMYEVNTPLMLPQGKKRILAMKAFKQWSDPVTGLVWPRGWAEVQLYSSMTAALEGGEWSAARPGRTLPPGKTRYPLYRRLRGPQGRYGWAENFVPTGIRSRTVQPIAQSLYRLSHPAHHSNSTHL